MLLYKILVYTKHGKIYKSNTKTINLKHLIQRVMRYLNYQMDRILYQTSKVILSISSKNMK